MSLLLLAGSANPALARAVADRLGVRPAAVALRRFPDGELHVQLDESVRGRDVYVIQPTAPPVESPVFELLLLADACHRAGASRVTAVVPYLGYARQDRRATGREAVGVRVVADVLATARLARVVAVDLHSAALEGVFGMPLEHLTAVPLLVEAMRAAVGRHSVVVAPDLGAAKLAERYARALDLPVALVHKTRVSGEAVAVRAVTGEVRDRAPVIVDDVISTGSTVVAAVEAVRAAGALPELVVVATHALLAGRAAERLRALDARRIVVADSVAVEQPLTPPFQSVGLAPLLADAVARLHEGRSLAELITHA